jgi:hypothetical protein
MASNVKSMSDYFTIEQFDEYVTARAKIKKLKEEYRSYARKVERDNKKEQELKLKPSQAMIIPFKYQRRKGSIQIANNGEVFVAWATVGAQLSGFVPEMRAYLQEKIDEAQASQCQQNKAEASISAKEKPTRIRLNGSAWDRE